MSVRIVAINLLPIDLDKSWSYCTYDIGMWGHLYPRCPPFQKSGGKCPRNAPPFRRPWKKVLMTLLGFFGAPRSDSATGELRPLVTLLVHWKPAYGQLPTTSQRLAVCQSVAKNGKHENEKGLKMHEKFFLFRIWNCRYGPGPFHSTPLWFRNAFFTGCFADVAL